MKRMMKFMAWSLLALLAAGVAALLWYRGASLPQIDGRLDLPGLQAPVEIVRDAEGVPHIYAQSEQDAWFALGVVHAQDRLWQMEMHRRIAAGRMAEVLGPNALPTDRFMRTLGVRRNAEAILSNLSAEGRGVLEAYARGVNAWLARRGGPLPPEYLITGSPAPQPWEAADSIGWQTMMAWDLSANWNQEALRLRLSQRLTQEQINQFLPPYPGDAILPSRDYRELYAPLQGVAGQLGALLEQAPPSWVEGKGSNNWVVGGAQSQTGKPLLANDPHLGLVAPALWYLAHLSAPGFEVLGATMPGIPAVVLGRNDRIAWGFTNTASDVQDLYIERVHPEDPARYQTPDGWADFITREEVIKVKGRPDEVLHVRQSRHGPVLSGALAAVDRLGLDAQQYVVALSWTALRPDDLTVQAGFALNRARNWEQFIDALRDFSAPQQNIVYADVDGNIGFIAPGKVPLRAAANDLHGLAPAPGWDARYDWQGFIPFEALPRSFNPARGRIASANEKIVGPDYPYFLTSEWTLPYRAERIEQLLAASASHSIASFGRIQADHVSLAARELLPLLREVRPLSERGRAALAMLTAWRGEMARDRAEPLIFNAWLRQASQAIFGDELGPDLMRDYWEQRNIHQPMVNVLKNTGGQGVWCANAAQSPRPPQDCRGVLAQALEDALDVLQQRHGQRMEKWRWGDAHVAVSEHRPFGKLPLLGTLFNVEVPSAGDTYTINTGRYSLREDKRLFASRTAPGLRMLIDLSDLESSRFMHPTGQSGHVLSPWYRNFSQRWADVEYITLPARRERVERDSVGILRLRPQGVIN